VINKERAQFPIVYSGTFGKFAIGWGAYLTVADECKKANIKKALIVTTGLKSTGIVDEIKGVLNYNGVSTEIYDKVTSNPKDYEIMNGYEFFKESKCDGVVSVGGGSSHDCGKGIRIVNDNGGKNIDEFAAGQDWLAKPPDFKTVTTPQVAINTTAGTAAETSFAAMVTDTKKRVKQPIIVAGAIPVIAIIDPALVRMMPQTYAAWTGWDAFAHAFESFVSCIESPGSQAVTGKAIQLFAENIREFVWNRMNHRACEAMCWAEQLGGTGVQFGGGVGIVHAFGHHISALTGAHHGRANAALTLAGERYNEPACPEKFGEMARIMGIDTRGLTKMEAADKWFDEVERLLVDLDITSGHLTEQFGFTKDDIKLIRPHLPTDYVVVANARAFNLDEWCKMVEGAL
jgi:formaldehyde dismutase / methanol dehydrogenase